MHSPLFYTHNLILAMFHTKTINFSIKVMASQMLVSLLCVFTFLVPCCDDRYDFPIKKMFGSYLSPIYFCKKAHVLFK
jgi:hypothetical protein